MAADDAAKDAPDPWDDIVAGLSETAGELSFNFDEPDPDAAASSDDVPAAAADALGMPTDADDAPTAGSLPPDVTPPGDAPAGEPDDALVDDWLSGMEDPGEVETGLDTGMFAADAADVPEEPAPPLAVFAPDDAAAVSGEPAFTAFTADAESASDDAAHDGDDDSADDADLVDFMAAADAGPTGGDDDPWGALDETAGAAGEMLDAAERTFDDQAGGGQFLDDQAVGQEAGGDADDGFPDVAAAAVAGTTAAVAAPAARPAKAAPPKPRKKPSAIGQIVGIVLGGLMAIPITLAILIWGLGKDPFKVTKVVPEQVAFLLPEKFRPGFTKPAADGGAATGGASLDDLPAPDLAAAQPDGEPAPTDVATAQPADPADMPEPDLPLPDLGAETDPAATPDDLAVAPPSVEPAAPPPPPPLDTSGLDAAVAEAAGFVEALGAVDDPSDRTRKKLLVEWYKALARVGEQLSMLEKTAADSGRSLEDATAGLGDLHARIAAQPALAGELERLGRNWLSYAKRDSPGVVLPLTFESARRSGPFWETAATLAQADGSMRSITVVTLAEPSAVAGDRIVCTGIVLANGTVVWAADCRTPAAPAGAGDPLF